MTEIDRVMTTVNYTGWHLDELKEMFEPARIVVVDPDDDEAVAREIALSDVAVLRADLDERYVAARNLKWIHCDHSGLNGSAKAEVFRREDLRVTGSAGRAAPALAQHALFLTLALVYDAPGLERVRAKHEWRGLPGYSDRRGLWGKTIGIIGMGHTGREMVSLAKACGMNVLAYGRGAAQSIDGVDTFYDAYNGDTIEELLRNSDVVVLSVRLTDQTRHLIGQAQLRMMKKSAYLINIARGAVVDEEALVDALHAGEIAGAGLDVFTQEPLPADAPIWDAPNVVLTHHTTAEMPDLTARSLDIIRENVRRYRADEPLLNQIKPSDVYSFADKEPAK